MENNKFKIYTAYLKVELQNELLKDIFIRFNHPCYWSNSIIKYFKEKNELTKKQLKILLNLLMEVKNV